MQRTGYFSVFTLRLGVMLAEKELANGLRQTNTAMQQNRGSGSEEPASQHDYFSKEIVTGDEREASFIL